MSESPVNWERTQSASKAFTVLDAVDSTNSWLAGRAKVRPSEIVLTMNQTGGRGRFGRQWINQPGEGLAFSFILPSPAESGDHGPALSWIPLLVGAALVQSVRSVGVLDANLKWPNDVIVRDRKLAGILCEVRPDGHVVAGVGLNVKFSAEPPDSKAVSLDDLLDDVLPVLDHLVEGVILRVTHLLGADLRQRLDVVSAVLGTIGRSVQVLGKDGSRQTGLAQGLNDRGGLLVRMESGDLACVISSDVLHLSQ